ncbi:cell envelope protein SmpA [Tardibacter chloracetimidivorans]|uniref:Cell envelope protein SmpA n=1 Tax=Tardibacter chloracetimidivorans TaxID=1921510 RepID=A0A1L3ZQU7_9SPHN|nr:outer membrane protein assembly factor BamE [Tardibacter chloracetimidivorans]API58001.1 cell envelope protein SmpA [Tardibacter chloracetimidivorans]
MAVWAKRAAITLTLAAVAATASGCARVRNHQGYVADTTLVQSIQPGVDNRDSVMKTLGRPSFEAEFDKNAWYYVSRETRQFGFNRPKPREQMVLVVQFDPKGTVSNVARHGMEDVVDIAMVRDKTPTLGRKTGFFQDLFGNIGAVGAGGAGAGGPGDTP